MRMIFTLLFALILAVPVAAVQPDEMLDDPVLEQRARDISAQLRCPVCRSEDIDNSSALTARQLRLLVRERLVAGDTDQQVLDYVVARYNEYVLFNPPRQGATLVLWLLGPGLLLLGAGMAAFYVRRGCTAVTAAALSVEEQERLKDLLDG